MLFVIVEYPDTTFDSFFLARRPGATIDMISAAATGPPDDRRHVGVAMAQGLNPDDMRILVTGIEHLHEDLETLQRDERRGTWMGRFTVRERALAGTATLKVLQFQEAFGAVWTHAEAGITHLRARVNDPTHGEELAADMRKDLQAAGIDAQVEVRELGPKDYGAWDTLVQASIGWRPEPHPPGRHHTPYDPGDGVARMAIRVPLVPLLLAALLAGCSDPPARGPAETLPTCADAAEADCVPLPPLTSESSVAAPSWAIGQWWEWQPEDAGGEGTPFRSVVVATGASGSTLGSDEPGRAKQAAAYGHLLLGEVQADLGVTAFGGAWDLLSFPLTDGKSWTTTIPNIAWDIYLPAETVDVAMRADFDAELEGFRIMGHVADAMLIEGTYLPATGWFGELTVYDVDPEQDPLEFTYRATATGTNHTGPVYTATAEPLLNLVDANGFDNLPTEGGQPVVSPQPHGTFTMAAGTQLYGIIVAISVVGGRVVTLTDPANEQRQVVATGAPEGEQVLELDEAGVAGAWTVATSGAGGLSMAIVELYEVTVTETVL